jgi:hypothetical protein
MRRNKKAESVSGKRIVVGMAIFFLYISILISPMIIKIKGPGKKDPLLLPPETNNITYSIDIFEKRTVQYIDLLEIYGWAFMDGGGSKESKISLVLKSDRSAYVLDSNRTVRRMDVAMHFGNRDLEDSGFMVALPDVFLDDGEYKVGILIKKDGQEAFRYVDRVITKYNKTLFPFSFSPMTDIFMPKETDNITCSIDSLRRFIDNGLGFISIDGWAFVKREGAVGQRTSIVLKSEKDQYVFVSAVRRRVDVTAFFKKADYDNSGFHVLFPEDFLKKGRYKVGICIGKGEHQILHYTDKVIERK